MPVIQLELDSKGAISSLQKFDKAVDTTERNVTPKFATIAKAAAALAVAVAGVAILVAKQSIEAAARMEEAGNKYNVVFEGMTDASDMWVKELTDNYALSTYAATEYLASTKAIIDGTNMQSEAAAILSNKVVQLAQDLASFHDKSPEQAVRAMTSALTGEYEAMKQFGVVLKKTEITQQAMITNNLETKDSVTNAMMAQAVYTLIIQRSGKALGDTIRSQDTYTFQLKKAVGLIMNMKVAIGEHLLPYATKLLTAMNDWVTANEALIDVKLDEFFDNAGQMVRQLGEAVVWTYERMVAFSNSLALFEAVGNDQLSWFEFATMNAKEAAEWLDKHRVVVEEDTEALTKNKEALIKVKSSLDIVNEATNESISTFEGYAEGVKSVTDATTAMADEVAETVIPTEKELKEEIDKVIEAVKNSILALNGQAVAAEGVAKAVNSIADAAAEVDRLKAVEDAQREEANSYIDGTSGGSHSFSYSTPTTAEGWAAEAAASHEMDKIIRDMNDIIFAGVYSSPFKTDTTGSDRQSSLNNHERFMSFLAAGGSSADWAGASLGIEAQPSGGTTITNNFNQQVSNSDITTITDQQITNTARA